jgi:hypothetical protein
VSTWVTLVVTTLVAPVRPRRPDGAMALVYSGQVLALAGPLAVASAVLAVGGVFKLRDPGSALGALRALRLPARRWAVRALGVAEVTVGVIAFLVGGPVAAAMLAGFYLLFTGVALRLVGASAGGTTCGCFGNQSSDTTVVHVVVNLAITLVVAAAAVLAAPGFLAARPDLVAGGAPYLLLVALGTWSVVVALTVLPDTLSAARRVPATRSVKTFALRGSGSAEGSSS